MMISNTKLFLAIVFVTLFDVALMNDYAKADAFLLHVGDRHLQLATRRPPIKGNHPGYWTAISEAVVEGENGRFMKDENFKKAVLQMCKIHLRNLILKQLLQIEVPWQLETMQYLGCIACAIDHQFPQIDPIPRDGYTYFLPELYRLSYLLESVGKLIRQQEKPDQGTAEYFARSYRQPQNGPIILTICAQVAITEITADPSTQLRHQACAYIGNLITAILQRQHQWMGGAGPSAPSY